VLAVPLVGRQTDCDAGEIVTDSTRGASVKYAYAMRPELWPVARSLNESPGQLHTVQVALKAPVASATAVNGKYDESAEVVLHGCVRFFTLSNTFS